MTSTLLSAKNLSVRFGGLPQVMPNFMSYMLLRLEINVRASTIIGAVGGGGIGQELKLAISRGFGAKTLALVLLNMASGALILGPRLLAASDGFERFPG